MYLFRVYDVHHWLRSQRLRFYPWLHHILSFNVSLIISLDIDLNIQNAIVLNQLLLIKQAQINKTRVDILERVREGEFTVFEFEVAVDFSTLVQELNINHEVIVFPVLKFG